MMEQKSFEDYWDLVKTWLKEHRAWVDWPVEKLSKLFNEAWGIIQEGSTQERMILAGVILAFFLVTYLIFILGLREILIRLPGFNRVPLGLPKSDDYQVKPTGFDHPVDFEWRYPNIWVGGTQFNIDKCYLDKNDPLHFFLKTNTEILFVRKPKRKKKG